jgi:hypothetical protein
MNDAVRPADVLAWWRVRERMRAALHVFQTGLQVSPLAFGEPSTDVTDVDDVW